MKNIKIATIDGTELDFVSVSEPDGEELQTYISQRLLDMSMECKEKGEKLLDLKIKDVTEFKIRDYYAEKFISKLPENLVEIEPGIIDFYMK